MSNTLILYGNVANRLSDRNPAQAIARLPGKLLQDSVRKYHHLQDRWMSLLGKQLLLEGLRIMQFQLPDGGLPLAYGAYGRPGIPGGPDFSISHSKGKVVVALATSGLVGIDLQENLLLDDRRLSQVFSAKELDYWRRGRGTVAYYWSRKEALSKLLGFGMRMDYRKLLVVDAQLIHDNQTYHLHNISAPAGFCCNIATDQPLKIGHHARFQLDGAPGLETLFQLNQSSSPK